MKCDWCLNEAGAGAYWFDVLPISGSMYAKPVVTCEICQRKHTLAELKQKMEVEAINAKTS